MLSDMNMLSLKSSNGTLRRLSQWIDPYLLLVILLSLYIPWIGVHLYFRYDDAGTLLWALDFKKSIFHAFDPAPWFDEYNFYNGVGGYYRPFESLYIMLLVKIFGPEPFYFHLINGILVITSVVFMYQIAVLLSGSRLAGLMSAAIFHLAFQSILYGTYHVVVPFGFFFELITFYLFIKGLYQQQFRTIALGFLFLIPATNRQTTALIVTAMVVIFFILHWRESKFRFWERIAIFVMASVPNLLIPFTKNSSHATILSQPFSVSGYWHYIIERLAFYSNLMTSRLTGAIIIGVLCLFWLTNLPLARLFPKIPSRWFSVMALPLSMIAILIALKIQPIAIVVLYVSLFYLFFAERSLQLVIIWFVVSLGLFSIINFYHDAYFLEAAFALAIVLGKVLYRSVVKLQHAFDVRISPRWERGMLLLCGGAIVSFGAIAWNVPGLPIIGPKVEAVKILIETNQNFQRMFEYLASELPANAKVFQLSEEYLGLTMTQRRFLPLRERAENVKVINILDSNVMIKVLGRWDIEFKHAEGLMLGIPDNCVFIVHNKLEKRIAMQKFQLEPIRQFKNHNTEAGVYRVIAVKEPL